MKRPFVLPAIGLLGLMVGAIVFLQRDPSQGTSVAGPTPAVVWTADGKDDREGSRDISPATPQGASRVAKGDEVVITPGIPAIEGEAPMIPSLTLQRGELAWEKQLRGILNDAAKTDAEKASALLALLATIPAEGRETAAEEAVKRIANADYRVAQPHVTSAGTYGLALGVLFADLMERPDDLRLPTLLTIARNPQHPFADAARDNLNLLLRVQHGTDWTQWDAAIRARLAGSR